MAGAPRTPSIVVIPNMPGYGFSGKPTTTGWDPIRMGRAYVALMKRLGYERFVAAGGDYGALVVDYMAGGRDAPASPEPAPPELLGIHTNFPGVFPLDVDTAIRTGGAQSSDLSAAEQLAAEMLGAAYKHAAYAVQMGTRPQTMYGLNDSPVFLAAYMLDHDPISYGTLIRPAFVDGDERGLTRDDILDNITMFWLTNTGVSTAKSYWEYLGYGSFANVRQRHHPGGRERLPRRALPASRGAGRRRRTPTSSTSTRSTAAGTSPPGSSRSCTPPSCARGSARFGSPRGPTACRRSAARRVANSPPLTTAVSVDIHEETS